MTRLIDGPGGAPLLEATNLTVRYGKVKALDGLDIVARPGEVLTLVGPNGAGKTTFLRAIATLIAPSGGRVRVRGLDVVNNPTAVRREIGLSSRRSNRRSRAGKTSRWWHTSSGTRAKPRRQQRER